MRLPAAPLFMHTPFPGTRFAPNFRLSPVPAFRLLPLALRPAGNAVFGPGSSAFLGSWSCGAARGRATPGGPWVGPGAEMQGSVRPRNPAGVALWVTLGRPRSHGSFRRRVSGHPNREFYGRTRAQTGPGNRPFAPTGGGPSSAANLLIRRPILADA